MTYAAARQWLPAFLLRRLYHFECAIGEAVVRFAASLEPGCRVLDAGAGEGQYAAHFSRQRYTGVDLAVGDASWDYRSLHAIAHLESLPFAGERFDAALSVVTLEHVRQPEKVMREMARVMRPGARLLLVAPQEWEVHQAPHDYFRYTRFGILHLLDAAGLRAETLEPAGGIFRLLARRLLMAARLLPVLARIPALLVCVPLALILPWLDSLDREKSSTLGYICIARKP